MEKYEVTFTDTVQGYISGTRDVEYTKIKMCLFYILCFDLCKLSQQFKLADSFGPRSELPCKFCTGNQLGWLSFLL